MYCSNCGARLSDTDIVCPYCGYTSPEKEESAYMKHLNDILEDTKDLADLPATEYKAAVKKQSRRALKIFLIVAAVFLVPIGGFTIYRGYRSYLSHQEFLEETRFEKNYFPKLNELYRDGTLQESYDFMMSLSDEKGFGAIFHWTHYAFLASYGDYLYLQEILAELPQGTVTESDLDIIFYNAINITRNIPTSSTYCKLSEEEKNLYQIWQKDYEDCLSTLFGLSSADTDALYPDLCYYEAVIYSECKKYVHSVLPNIKETYTITK